MDKNAIKKFAVWARRELIERVAQRAARFSIEENKPVDEKARVIDGRVLSDEEFEQRRMLIVHIRRNGYKQVMEEVAYTWFNRFIALRFMEVNGYLPSYVRVFSNESGAFDPQILSEALHVELYGLDMEKVFELEENDKKEELFKYLLITQCNDIARMLPGLFETIADYTELLFPDNLLREGSVIEQMVTAIPEADWKDAVQIIGWLYQYYITELNEIVYDGTLSSERIDKNLLPAATTIYTPDWAVRYMVENSLGHLWTEGHPSDTTKDGWKYYLEEAPQEPEVEAQLVAIRAEYAKLDPAQILCCDPCMGSGHILVYMFDVLMQIYLSYGYTTNEAVESIVRNNLWGMDIDDRAAQLAYFAVMMKAQQYDNRWLAKQLKHSAQPNVFALQDSPEVSEQLLSLLGDQQDVAERMLDAFRDAKEYGSIIKPNVTVEELNALSERLDAVLCAADKQRADVQADIKALFDALWPQISQCRALAQKYHVIVTNPPYLGSSRFSLVLDKYVKKYYSDVKADLSSILFKHAIDDMAYDNAFISFITTASWITLSSFEALRQHLIRDKAIVSLIDFGMELFEGKVGHNPIVSWVTRNTCMKDYQLAAIRLVDFCYSQRDKKQTEFFNMRNRYTVNQARFSIIPGSPIAYWTSDAFIEPYLSNTELLGAVAAPCAGLATGNNDLFQRFWYEVGIDNIGFGLQDVNETVVHAERWYPCNSGGEFRKWYPADVIVVNWYKNGQEIKQYKNKAGKLAARPQNTAFYFKEGLTWNKLSSSRFAVRYKRSGFIFDDTSRSAFPHEGSLLFYYIGVLCSCVTFRYLQTFNSTMSFTNGDLVRIPIIVDSVKKENVERLVKDNIRLSRSDWDSFESSWDFSEHPVIRWSRCLQDATSIGATMQYYYGKHIAVHGPLELCYLLWQGECNKRFTDLKANEEELNRIVIAIYGFQGELTPEVDDKDVTVSQADLGRDIRSLISYAVGCMFGRYCTDEPGLIFAGGNFGDYYETLNEPVGEYLDRVLTVEHDKVTVDATTTTACGLLNHNGKQIKLIFPPDADGIIPITDDEYFNDDIVSMFVRWLERVFGRETLEENLKFIADALGGRGTPRDVLRQYFLNDFYKDHLKVYQKRPIYWLFDSGKKNGFKCLIYMHRYQPDTLARIRTDYLHELQGRYRNAIETLERQIAGASTSERVKLQRRLTTLKAQAEEARVYEEKIHHLADQMIKIDLDDGVKHNYTIFKDVLAPIK